MSRQRQGEPSVSVLMAVYNGEEFVGRALATLFAQTFPDFELIVVDDGSIDATARILADCEDPRLRVLGNEQNLGLVRSLNRGLEHVRGEFTARMDHDDEAAPDRLAKEVNHLREHPDCVAVSSWYWLVGQDGERAAGEPPVEDAPIRWRLLFGTPLCHSGLMVRTAALRELDGYDGSFPHVEDYELECRLSRLGELHNLPEHLLTVRALPEGVSLSHEAQQDAAKAAVSAREMALLLGVAQVEPELRAFAEAIFGGWKGPLPDATEQGVAFCVRLTRAFAREYDCDELAAGELGRGASAQMRWAYEALDNDPEEAVRRAKAAVGLARGIWVPLNVTVPAAVLKQPALYGRALEDRRVMDEFRRRGLMRRLNGRELLSGLAVRLRDRVLGGKEAGKREQ